MFIEMKKRKYRLQRRAAQQQRTRERIVDAAMALHEELGPAATTISALAERAGVQRLTVYRHFAGDEEILEACSARWIEQHPPPAMTKLPAGDSAARTRAILRTLYRYYEETQGMWRSLYRDRGEVEALEAPMRRFDDYLGTVEQLVLAECQARRTKRLRATVGHALRFPTWQSLDEQGLEARAMAALVAAWIAAAAA